MNEIKRSDETTIRMYVFIQQYVEKHGYAPSIEEIGKAMNQKSRSTTHYHMMKMFDAGWLETDLYVNGHMCPRAYRIVKNPLEKNRC